jgi:hypothetical protein
MFDTHIFSCHLKGKHYNIKENPATIKLIPIPIVTGEG